MRPVQFKYANRMLAPPDVEYSENVARIDSLPVWSDGEQCVSCWQMSLRERLSALVFGRVWLSLLSGATQPPACVVASRGYLQQVES